MSKYTDFLITSMLHILSKVYTCVQLLITHTVLYVCVRFCNPVHMSVQFLLSVTSIKLFVHFRTIPESPKSLTGIVRGSRSHPGHHSVVG